jgi:hypothetical protein
MSAEHKELQKAIASMQPVGWITLKAKRGLILRKPLFHGECWTVADEFMVRVECKSGHYHVLITSFAIPTKVWARVPLCTKKIVTEQATLFLRRYMVAFFQHESDAREFSDLLFHEAHFFQKERPAPESR